MRLLYFHPPDETFAGAGAVFQPDEDYIPIDAQPLPEQVTYITIWMDDGGFTLTQFDEDFWQSGVAPVAAFNARLDQFLFEPSETALFSKFTSPDEDFWVNQVKPVYRTLQVPNYALFEDQVPAGQLLAEMDEDYWINWVRPVVLRPYQQLPLMGLTESDESVPQSTSGSAPEAYQIYGMQGLQERNI